MNTFDELNRIVFEASKAQDLTTRMELLEHLITILESPKFKAMSAMDVVQSVRNKLLETKN